MNRIGFLLLTLVCLSGSATLAQSRFSLAPTVGYGFQNNNVSVHTRGQILDTHVTNASGHWAAWAGLNAHYTFSSRWSASAGLVYNRASGDVSVLVDLLPDLVGPWLSEYTTKATTQTLQMPVSINYTSSSRRLSPYLSAGFVLNYNYRFQYENLTHYYPITDIDRKLTDSDALSVRPTVGAGVIYRISPKVALIVQPNVIYTFRKAGDTNPSTNQAMQVGLQTQMQVSF
jgi:Outer membrane protein beta-barrel domain